jgi:hypothetical protein
MQENGLFDGLSLWRRRKKQVDVGAQFERVHADRTVETAKVLSVMEDSLGIPHVRYALTIKKPQRPLPVREGPRLLALKAFSAAYRVRVGSYADGQ